MYKRFPTEYQMDSQDCGPASLKMVAKYYGRYFSLQYLRDKCGLTKEGVRNENKSVWQKYKIFPQHHPIFLSRSMIFYNFYRFTFKQIELGRIYELIPFKQLVTDFGLRRNNPHRCGKKPFFTPEGKIAIAFLLMYTGLSLSKLTKNLHQ